jgi:regulator of sirC expression with transglutaminase-like and TPR domain
MFALLKPLNLKLINSLLLLITLSISTCISNAVESKMATNSPEVSTYPIWSPLTPFETATLRNIHRAKRGDANALLMLYLFASGDSREFAQYNQYLKAIDNLVTRIKPNINKETTVWQKGFLIHQAMHETFLTNRAKNNKADHYYSFDQSKLSQIFKTKQYNCISSALLFTILARKFDLDVSGVLLPSHAFVQINLPNGKSIEVETTTPLGYDWVHDEEFYRQKQRSWFKQRGLTPSSYKDYMERNIVSPFEFGVHNMNNQHTTTDRMERPSRLRLAEVLAWLDTDNLNAHKHLLFLYNNEFVRLNKVKDYDSLDVLFSKTASQLATLTQYKNQDKDIANMAAWLDSQIAYTAAVKGREEEAITMATKTLGQLTDRIKDKRKIRKNAYISLNTVAQERTKNQRFEQALEVYRGEYPACVKNAFCSDAVGFIYSSWGQFLWDKGQWSKAIVKYNLFLELENRGEAADLFKKNRQSAYLNWANEYSRAGDWRKVENILSQCIKDDNKANKCQDNLKKIKRRHW